MKFILILFAIGFTITNTQAQHILSGKVIDKETNQPIPFANVYLAYSQIGTTTKVDGTFELKVVTEGKHEILVSFVGYKTYKAVYYTNNLKSLEIKLEVDRLVLTEATVGAKRDKKWEKDFRRFQRIIFGSEEFSKECEFLNPWHLEFSHENGSFSAKSNQLLQIKNQALGYEINYYLRNFVVSSELTVFSGIPVFRELVPKNAAEYQRWQENRLIAYHGSLRHFFSELINGNPERQGFVARLIGERLRNTEATYDKTASGLSTAPGKKEILRFQGQQIQPFFRGYLQVEYNREYLNGRPQKSWIRLQGETLVSKQGILSDPDALIVYGQMGTERIAHTLPIGYQPHETVEDGFKQQFYRHTVQQFRAYHEEKFTEKIHLHTDKDLYFPGENIWLKSYLSIGNVPSKVSNKIYTELIDKEGHAIQNILPIKEGTGSGAITLSDSIKEGTYLLRAYTQRSKDLPDDFQYEKLVQIGLEDSKETITGEGATVKLFPEGGHFVKGVENRFAFEIRDANGNLIDEEIEILNNKGKIVKNARTSWQGKGSFQLKAKKKESYLVKIKSDLASATPIEASTSLNTAIQISQTDTDVKVALNSASKEKQVVHLLITNHEKVVGFKTYEVTGSYTSTFPLVNLPDGINHFIFFDITQKPVAERLIYVMPKEKANLQIGLQATVHQKRSKEHLEITGTDAIRSASVSVIDLGQSIESGNENILVNYYLRPDIRGSVINSEALFQERNPAHFDLTMMTNGWSRYNWEAISSFQAKADPTIVLQEGFDIKGVATFGKRKRLLTYHDLLLVPLDSGGTFFQTTTDSLGNFTFENIRYYDSTTLIFRSANPKFKKPIQLSLDNSTDWKSMPTSFTATTQYLSSQETQSNSALQEKADYREKVAEVYDFDGKTYYLEEAVVKGKKEEEKRIIPRVYRTPGTRVIDLSEVPIAQLGGGDERTLRVIERYVPGAIVTRLRNLDGSSTVLIKLSGSQKFAAFYLNNAPSDPNVLLTLPSNQIETIEVLTKSQAGIFGVNGDGGVILAYTKVSSSSEAAETKPNFFQAKLKGYQAYKEFYSPDYSQEQDYIPDYRTTLYWNPDITNENREFSYYNHDNEGRIKVIAEGFTKNGTPFRLVEYYDLEK